MSYCQTLHTSSIRLSRAVSEFGKSQFNITIDWQSLDRKAFDYAEELNKIRAKSGLESTAPTPMIKTNSFRETRYESRGKTLEHRLMSKLSSARPLLEFDEAVLRRYANLQEFNSKVDLNMSYVVETYLAAPPFDVNNE